MRSRVGLALLALALAACAGLPSLGPTPTPVEGLVVSQDGYSTDVPSLPAAQARATQIQAALAQPIPILLLTGLDDNQALAQALALRDPRFTAAIFTPDGAPLRNEIFNVYPARQSDVTEATLRCQVAPCYRVELYNYALNLTTVAIVDVTGGQTLVVNTFPDTQPDIPLHLKQLALDIAVNAPEVERALGFKPSADLAVMESTKTALNNTRCQRSQHLCVAPTFVLGERALWAIVDLTDAALVGVRWTELGDVKGGPVTERSLQNDVVTAMYCERLTAFERDGWEFNYILTSSDGLRVSEARFNGQPVLESAKLVDWHVSYSVPEAYGYSDAIGCPMFSQAAVVAFQGPTVEDLREGGAVTGFSLTQRFWSDLWPLPCNYYYVQRFEFYRDGRFRVVAGNIGRGCGADGVYRPVLRIALAGPYTAAAWNGSAWETWERERWQLQSEGPLTPEGYQYRLLRPDGSGFYLEPGRGQFGDGGRGDNAFFYVTRRQADRDEGDSDMITIGPCCNTNHEQGPEKFITPPEPITNSELVLWYTPQIEIDNTPGREYCWADSILLNGVYVSRPYPCYAGPLFVPVSR
jgi:hypothetical protein